jgi:hypothetical protein
MYLIIWANRQFLIYAKISSNNEFQ